MARRKDKEQVDVKQQESKLKQESKALIYKLNGYLGVMLALIIFSHRYALNFLADPLLDIIRGVCMGVCCYIICSTMNSAIEFNGSFAYKNVMEFFEAESSEKRAQLKKKIVLYIYYIWYHYFQFIARLIIPLFLFLMIITWKYLFFQVQIVDQPLAERSLNTNIQCPLHTDQMSLLQNTFRCAASSTIPNPNEERYFLGGMLQSIPVDLPQQVIQANMQKYTILQRNVMLQFFQVLFWYSSVSIYLMTVVYIGFLRKTVYDL